MVLYHNLHLLVCRDFGIQFAEHLLCIETAGYKKDEMRRFLRNISSELVRILFEPVRLNGHSSFKLVPDEDDFLYVAGEPLLLHISPFLLLRIRSGSLRKEHISQSYKENDIYP